MLQVKQALMQQGIRFGKDPDSPASQKNTTIEKHRQTMGNSKNTKSYLVSKHTVDNLPLADSWDYHRLPPLGKAKASSRSVKQNLTKSFKSKFLNPAMLVILGTGSLLMGMTQHSINKTHQEIRNIETALANPDIDSTQLEWDKARLEHNLGFPTFWRNGALVAILGILGLASLSETTTLLLLSKVKRWENTEKKKTVLFEPATEPVQQKVNAILNAMINRRLEQYAKAVHETHSQKPETRQYFDAVFGPNNFPGKGDIKTLFEYVIYQQIRAEKNPPQKDGVITITETDFLTRMTSMMETGMSIVSLLDEASTDPRHATPQSSGMVLYSVAQEQVAKKIDLLTQLCKTEIQYQAQIEQQQQTLATLHNEKALAETMTFAFSLVDAKETESELKSSQAHLTRLKRQKAQIDDWIKELQKDSASPADFMVKVTEIQLQFDALQAQHLENALIEQNALLEATSTSQTQPLYKSKGATR